MICPLVASEDGGGQFTYVVCVLQSDLHSDCPFCSSAAFWRLGAARFVRWRLIALFQYWSTRPSISQRRIPSWFGSHCLSCLRRLNRSSSRPRNKKKQWSLPAVGLPCTAMGSFNSMLMWLGGRVITMRSSNYATVSGEYTLGLVTTACRVSSQTMVESRSNCS